MDVLDLKAKISLDKTEYDKGLDTASGQASSFGSKLASGIGGAVKTVAKVGAAAVGVASTAVVALTKQAVSSFADYEQLVGGVETLFGDSSEFVINRAKAAYETAGLSANQYMETVTSFSASLLQSLGGDTEAAARIADQAIIDMSDNANKMGSSMEAIQNAYQGFAKQNYTMLDNLKLGYGGTKEEMARLLEDAEKLSGQKFDLSSYADVVEAIHVIQENMGIAGTTAEEAATTISGSLSMVKSAWANTLTAIGEGDMTAISESIGDLVYSAQTFGENVIPVVQRALEGVVQLIGEIAPEIAAVIPSLVSDILPSVISAGMEIVSALGQALVDNIDTLLNAAVEIINMFMNALVEASSGEGGGKIGSIIETIVSILSENLPLLVDMGFQIISNIIQGISESLPTLIPMVVDMVLNIAQSIIENAPMLIDAGIQLILGLADGILQALPTLIERLPELVQSIIDALLEALPMLIEGAIQLTTGLIEALPEIIQALVDAMPQIIEMVVQGLLTAAPMLIEGIVQLQMAIVQAMPQIISALIAAIPQILSSIVDIIIESAPLFLDAITQIFASIGELFATVGGTWSSTIGEAFSNIINTAVEWLSQLPERAAYFAGQMVAQFINFIVTLPSNIETTFTAVINAVIAFGQRFITEAPRIAKDFAQKLIETLRTLPSKMVEIGRDIVNGLKNGISNAWSSFKDWMSGLVGDFIEGIKGNLRIGSPSKVMADEIGRWIPAGIAMGIEGNMGAIDSAIGDMYRDITPDITFGNVTSEGESNDSGLAQIVSLLTEIRNGGNVTVVLEGDADRLFRVMQSKANSNYRLTGNAGLITV